jgi:hypothetical protein
MKLIFTGDFSASGIFFQKISSDEEILDKEVREVFQEADYVNINLENPITNASFNKEKGSALKAPPNTAQYLKDRHINICTLANNHIMDCGYNGLDDTVEALNQNRILFYGVGGYHPYILLNKGDVKVALIASCHKEGPLWDGHKPAPFSFRIKELKLLIKDIRDNAKPDYIIFSYHGGTEFNTVPEPKRRKFFHKLVDLGIDIIIGHHAHVPQGIEARGKSIIIYGLGNFCFDTPYQRKSAYTSESFFIELNLAQGKPPQINKYYLKIDRNNGYVSLNKDKNCDYFFNNRLQVFENLKKYYTHWEREAFRVYCSNNLNHSMERSEDLGKPMSLTSVNKNVRNHIDKNGLIRILLNSTKMIVSDAKNPSRRPLLIGAIKFILKGGDRGADQYRS